MKLQERKIGLAALAVFFIFIVLYYFVVISPALSKRNLLSKNTAKKEAQLSEMMALQKGWEAFQQRRTEAEDILQKRGPDFTVLSFLERISREVGIDTRIQYIKPMDFPPKDGPIQPMGIEMRFEALDIKQVVDFLYRVEHSKNLLTIGKTKIQPSGKDDARSIELTLQVHTYGLSSR